MDRTRPRRNQPPARGLHTIWNADSLVLKWPPDQILPGPGLTLLSLQVLPAFSSDYHPFLAELCLNPAAAPRQPPANVEAAQTTARKRQGAADKGELALGSQGAVQTNRGALRAMECRDHRRTSCPDCWRPVMLTVASSFSSSRTRAGASAAG